MYRPVIFFLPICRAFFPLSTSNALQVLRLIFEGKFIREKQKGFPSTRKNTSTLHPTASYRYGAGLLFGF